MRTTFQEMIGGTLPCYQELYQEPVVERSSYAKHQLGRSLFSVACRFEPSQVIEFGVLDGYSLIALAQYARLVDEGTIPSPHEMLSEQVEVKGYDLFTDYPYNRPDETNLDKNLTFHGVKDLVTLTKLSWEEWFWKGLDLCRNKGGFPVQVRRLIHVDISNDGDKVTRVLEAARYRHTIWKDLGQTLILFEGGTVERDNVPWMKKYGARNMQPIFLPLIEAGVALTVSDEFPGLTLVSVKRFLNPNIQPK